MKYTRFEFKKESCVNLKQFVLKVIIIIPLIGLLLGYIISKFLVQPYLFTINKKPPSLYTYQSIKPRKFYTLQAGMFQSLNNAKQLADRMKSLKIPAFVREDGQYSRIIICEGTSYDLVKKKSQDLKSSGYDCIIKEVDVNAMELPERFRNDDIYISINELALIAGEIVDCCCDIESQYELGIDTIEAGNKLKNTFERMESVINKAKNYGSSENDFLGNVVKSSEHINNLAMSILENKADSWEKIMEMVYQYKKIIENYNNNIKYVGTIPTSSFIYIKHQKLYFIKIS